MDTHRKHILVVEDDLDVQQMISLYLHDSGYKVTFVNCGAEMYAFFKAGHAPSLVLLDLGLPDADGLQLAEQIRVFSSVPIFVLTARTEQKDKLIALGVGADDYLTKPFDPEELRLRISNLLSRSVPPTIIKTPSSQHASSRSTSVGVIALVVMIGVGLGLYTLLMGQPVDEMISTETTDFLALDISAKCRGADAIFTITNTGNRWPKPAEIRIYRVSSETTVLKRRLLMALNQSVTLNVTNSQEALYTSRNVGGEGVGVWVKPSWYEREFKYDATVNCR